MKTWLVTRHSGAIEWFTGQGIQVDEVIAHLDTSALSSGDRVIGTLPIHLVAELNAMNIEYVHLALTVPFELRGHELSAAEIEHCQPRLAIYSAKFHGNL